MPAHCRESLRAEEVMVCGAHGPRQAEAHRQREFGRLGKAALRLGRAGYARLHGGRVVQHLARRPMTRHRKRAPRGVREGLTGQESNSYLKTRIQ